MLGKMDQAVPEYAGPAFHNSPPASSLPTPRFFKQYSSGSGVRSTLSARKPPLDAVTYVQQAPPETKKPNDEVRKSASVTSDTESHDAKTAISATKEQDKPNGMIDVRPSRRLIASCLTYHVQKPEATLTTPFRGSVAFEKLIETLELRRRQAIIDRSESQTTNTTIQYAPQVRDESQEQRSTIPANVQCAAQALLQQMWMKELIQATGHHAAEFLMMYKRSTDNLQQLANKRLERNLAKQWEIEREDTLSDDEIGLTSSNNDDTLASTDGENTQVEAETDS